MFNFRNFRVSPEEAVWFPLRAMVVIGDADQQGSDDLFVFRCGGEVHRLVHVVGGRVIALGQPVLKIFTSGEPGSGATLMITEGTPWRIKLY